MSFERGGKLSQVKMAVHPSELLSGLDHAGCTPAERHRPVLPPPTPSSRWSRSASRSCS